MYLFIDHFEIKNKSLSKQVYVVLCSDPYSWCFGMIRGAPGVVRCSVSAASAIRCSVAPCPLVNVLLDAGNKVYFIFFFFCLINHLTSIFTELV